MRSVPSGLARARFCAPSFRDPSERGGGVPWRAGPCERPCASRGSIAVSNMRDAAPRSVIQHRDRRRPRLNVARPIWAGFKTGDKFFSAGNSGFCRSYRRCPASSTFSAAAPRIAASPTWVDDRRRAPPAKTQRRPWRPFHPRPRLGAAAHGKIPDTAAGDEPRVVSQAGQEVPEIAGAARLNEARTYTHKFVMSALPPKAGLRWRLRHVCFSNRPSGVKHFQTIHHCSVDVAHGLALLFGIGTKALPSWDPRTRWNNLSGGLAVRRTAGPSGHANSPHPSSREGHLSTAGWSSSFLLSDLIFHGFHAAATACSRLQRNSVPSTQMRCMITASRRASATDHGLF